jgi:hypothetical protein
MRSRLSRKTLSRKAVTSANAAGVLGLRTEYPASRGDKVSQIRVLRSPAGRVDTHRHSHRQRRVQQSEHVLARYLALVIGIDADREMVEGADRLADRGRYPPPGRKEGAGEQCAPGARSPGRDRNLGGKPGQQQRFPAGHHDNLGSVVLPE